MFNLCLERLMKSDALATRSLIAIGADAVVTADAQTLRDADKIILPGVGAFGDAAKKLADSGLDRILIE
ncbi:MAG: hypothetical protein IKV49_00455, partial [Clostridia bacterium]|nr:hypothetical protein [Clostridia bacterium]